MIALGIRSNFTENSIISVGNPVTFTYIPEGGNIEKTVYFYLNNI